MNNLQSQALLLAEIEAKTNWKKDLAMRKWVTRHGGIYVKPNDRTPPNPYLSHLPHRDKVTTDGVELTMMNPAYMMRQLVSEFEEDYGVKGKITGKILLNPINKADPWEEKVLDQFSAGDTNDAIEVQIIDNEDYLRFMRPMFMTSQGCVDCHGHLGFKLGDLRGGVSVSVPLEPYYNAIQKTVNAAILAHSVFWILGIIFCFIYATNQCRIAREKRETELLVQRSLRMDSIGQMAGGVAHDFNNLLGVIKGNADLLARTIDGNEKASKRINAIDIASDRGIELTRRLLNFSRGKVAEKHVLNPEKLILDVVDLLQHTLAKTITIKTRFNHRMANILIDESEMQDVLTNLIVNAKDAMPEGGELYINTSILQLETDQYMASHYYLDPGDYIKVSVCDNGEGISKDLQEKIFEPFFTTKDLGKGTGLGLSMAYAVIKRAGGCIELESERGVGSTFNIYLPIVDWVENKPLNVEDSSHDLDGTETILVVDDEVELTRLVKSFLNDFNYKVITTIDTDEAIDILRNNSIDLLLTDIMMPKCNGFELAEQARQINSNIVVVYCSGYTGDSIRRLNSKEMESAIILSKPFSHDDILKAIRNALDKEAEK